MRIVVVGAGGAGAFFGARWAQAGVDVTLLARGRQLEAIRASGVKIIAPGGESVTPVRATDDPACVTGADLVIFATKTWQLAAAVAPLMSYITGETAVVGLQNGVEAADELAKAVGPARALVGVCRIIAFVESPGVIRHVGVEPSIVIGERAGGLSPRVEALSKLLTVPGARVDATDDATLEIWRKFLFFAPVSGMGSVTRSTVGVYRSHPRTRPLLIAAMEEVYRLGLARGVKYPPDAVEKALAFVDSSPPDGTTSTSRDFADGRRTEIDALSGAVTRLGRESGVPTPTHDFISAVLAPQEARAREAAGA